MPACGGTRPTRDILGREVDDAGYAEWLTFVETTEAGAPSPLSAAGPWAA